jgi:opacity protein-like surface antigen
MTVAAGTRCVGIVALLLVAVLAVPDQAAAQERRRPAASPPAPRPQTVVRAFGDLGMTFFTASDTFDAVLGSPMGVVFGGGAEVVLPQRLFFSGRVSHFQKSGERVFVLDDEVFPLDIDTTVSITPVEVTAGYRFHARGRNRNMIPYLGGGVGWHRYDETADFAETGDDVSKTFVGYHVLGGAEFRMGRTFGIGGEAQWTTIPDALGDEPGSASAAFDESDLGGISFRVRFIIGR